MRICLIVTALLMAGCSGSDVELQPVQTVATEASNPTVDLGADGTRYIAWVGRQDGVDAVLLATQQGETFSPPVRVNHIPGDAAPHEQAPAQVATGPDNAVYVVWQNQTHIEGRRFPSSDLRFARSLDGGRTFDPTITINDDTASGIPSSHTFHDIAVAKDGAIYISWIDSRERDRIRLLNESRPVVSSGTSSASKASTDGGHGSADMPGSEIRFAVSIDGGQTFSTSRVIDGDVCPCCRTTLAIADDGSVYIAWRKVFAGDVRDIVVARKQPGALDFEAPIRVHEDGWVFPGCPHAGPTLAVDPAGMLHVAWYTGATERQGLWHARADAATMSFSTPRPLMAAAWVPPSQVKLTAAGNDVWAVWDDRRNEEHRLTIARLGDRVTPLAVDVPIAGVSPAMAAAADRLFIGWLRGEQVQVTQVVLR